MVEEQSTREIEEQSTSNTQNDISEAVKKVKLGAVKAVREANALPMRAEGYELYASYPAFANLMAEQRRRITVLLREVLRNAGCRAAVPAKINDLDEFLDRLVEANDSICERAGILLDLLQKAGRAEEVVVPQNIIDAESTAATEQSLYERQGRYTALLRRLPGNKDKPFAPAAAPALPRLTVKEKPQVVYEIQVDNSDAEFIPKLKEKHHALENPPPTNLQIVDIDTDDNASWLNDQETNLHPYHEELIHFKIPKRQLAAGLVQPLKALSDTELEYIDTLDKLEKLKDILNMEKEFSVDLEHNWFRSFLGLTCLMQISTRDVDYIIDPFPLWNNMHILNEPFTDPKILKVFHGADSDITWLQRDFGIYVVNMFDTYKAMRVLNYSKYSYQYLVQMCCNHALDKKLQKADWRLRPLTDAHKLYARSDTHYLLHCYDLLRKRLLEEGNESKNLLEYVYNESTQVCHTVYEKPTFESDGFERLVAGRKPLNSRQFFALEALWKWRDERARADDESPQYILPNHMMLQIAEVLPREMQGILACCSPVPVHVKQELHALHRIIVEARDQPLRKRPVYAPNIDSLTFEGVTSQLNKMNAVKALLRCHLDFSSTKYNEEIREFVTQKLDGAICQEAATSSSNGMLSADVYTIGEVGVKKESEHLAKVLKKIEEWATPYECYRIAMMERKAREEAENQEADKNEENEKDTPNTSEEKKLWSHLDPASNMPGFLEEKTSVAELRVESERRKKDEETSAIHEEMILTKKEIRKRRKQDTRNVNIPTTSEKTKNTSEISAKRNRKSNWTDAAEECEKRVDYSTFEPNLFKSSAPVSSAYDPFKQGKRGKWKSNRGRMAQRGRGTKW